MGPAPIRGQLVYSFARGRFVHNSLFQSLSSTGLAGTNLRESLKVDINSPQSVNQQTNNTFNIKPTGDRNLQLLLAARRKNTS